MRIPIACIFMSVALMGQGYDKTTWGMTEAQARAAYPGIQWSDVRINGHVLSDGICRMSKIDDIDVEVVLRFKDDHLSSAEVAMANSRAGTSDQMLAAMRNVSRLKNLLKDKYGVPTGGRLDPEWVLDGMTVKTRTMTMVPGLIIFSIEYKPRNAMSGL